MLDTESASEFVDTVHRLIELNHEDFETAWELEEDDVREFKRHVDESIEEHVEAILDLLGELVGAEDDVADDVKEQVSELLDTIATITESLSSSNVD